MVGRRARDLLEDAHFADQLARIHVGDASQRTIFFGPDTPLAPDNHIDERGLTPSLEERGARLDQQDLVVGEHTHVTQHLFPLHHPRGNAVINQGEEVVSQIAEGALPVFIAVRVLGTRAHVAGGAGHGELANSHRGVLVQ